MGREYDERFRQREVCIWNPFDSCFDEKDHTLGGWSRIEVIQIPGRQPYSTVVPPRWWLARIIDPQPTLIDNMLTLDFRHRYVACNPGLCIWVLMLVEQGRPTLRFAATSH